MAKTVFKNSMVAHVWAQQSQPEGRSANGQFYFDGPTIFSYGRHFPIATFLPGPIIGSTAIVLLTTRSYSVTTVRHISYVRHALRYDTEVVRVHDPLGSPLANYNDAIKCAGEAAKKAKRARTNKDRHLQAVESAITTANRLRELFPADLADKPVITPDTIDRKVAERRAEVERAQAAQRLKDADALAAWLAGADIACPWSAHDDAVQFRVYGATVQSTHGAEVPLADAVRLLRRCVDVRKFGTRSDFEGVLAAPEFGGFKLRWIEANGDAQVGCHHIEFSAMIAALKASRAKPELAGLAAELLD